MIVRVTRQQFEWLHASLINDAWVDVGGEFKHWFTDLHPPQQASQHRVDVVLPFIGWVVAGNRLFRLVYNEKGARVATKSTRSHERCVRGIAAALHWYERHPAFNGAGVFEPSTDIYPAWATSSGQQLLRSAAPREGWTMCAMVPQRLDDMNGQPTIWTATSLGELNLDGPLWVREHHEAFDRSDRRTGPLTPPSLLPPGA